MGIRYFSDSSAGAGDGTTWADRAAWLVSGTLNSIIKTWDYTTDSLTCLIEGGKTYSYTGNLTTTGFTTTPSTSTFQLKFCACDSSGVPLEYDAWNCAEGPLPTTGFFELTLGSSNTIVLRSFFEGCSVSASVNGNVSLAQIYKRCKITNSNSGTSATGINGSSLFDCHVICSGTSFNFVCATTYLSNVRIEGNSAASSGNRDGLAIGSGGVAVLNQGPVCVINCPGRGAVNTSTSSGVGLYLSDATIDNCGTGIKAAPSTTGAGFNVITNCVVANCTYGVSQPYGKNIIQSLRLRDNGTNYEFTQVDPTSGVYSTDADNTEYADYASGDLRIANDSPYWGLGLGAGDEPAASGGGGLFDPLEGGLVA